MKYALAAVIAALLFLIPKSAAPGPFFISDTGKYLMLEKANQVVMLTMPGNPRSGGTGFHVKAPSGQVYIVSNRHICDGAEGGKLDVWVPAYGRAIPRNIIYMAPDTDLCLIEAAPGATGLTLSKEEHLKDRLYTIGHPFLNPPTLSEGYVVGRTVFEMGTEIQTKEECEAKENHAWKKIQTFFGESEMCMEFIDAVDTTIPTFPGNSGSPVFNDDGEVEGVIFASDRRTNRGGYIPLNKVHEFLSVY